MNVSQFTRTVKAMRDAQKRYFQQGRKQSDLIESKKLEKRVDQAVEDGIVFDLDIVDMREDQDEPKQDPLFE